MILDNKYKVLEKIGSGNFGNIYKGENVRTKENVAIKIELKNNILNFNSLKLEANIYNYLKNSNGFPKMKYYNSNEFYSFLVLELLDLNLSKFIELNNNNYEYFLDINIIKDLGIQMINLIEFLHNKFIIHRDIKPENFLFGLKNNSSKLYLIDFGLSQNYYVDGEHIKQKEISNIIGSLNFVSLKIHERINPSRRDDIESIIYILLNLYYGKILWDNNINENINMNENMIYNFKKNLRLDNFDESIINDLITILKIIDNYNFYESPNYDLIKEIIIKI